jgi:hypothetical protein
MNRSNPYKGKMRLTAIVHDDDLARAIKAMYPDRGERAEMVRRAVRAFLARNPKAILAP